MITLGDTVTMAAVNIKRELKLHSTIFFSEDTVEIKRVRILQLRSPVADLLRLGNFFSVHVD
jgi:hypothetical protein